MSQTYSASPESVLVILARQGDGEAFAELIRRSRNVCLRTARSILRDDVEAEDQLQNAYLKAWRELGSFRQDSKFSTWLVRIVTNQCLMELRKQRRAPLVSIDPAGEDADAGRPLQIEDPRSNQERDLAARQISNVLAQEVSRVPGLLRGV